MSAAVTAEQFVWYLITPRWLVSVAKHYYGSKYRNRNSMDNSNLQNAFENISAEKQFWKTAVALMCVARLLPVLTNGRQLWHVVPCSPEKEFYLARSRVFSGDDTEEILQSLTSMSFESHNYQRAEIWKNDTLLLVTQPCHRKAAHSNNCWSLPPPFRMD